MAQPQSYFWQFTHNVVAHPLMGIFGYVPRWLKDFHDYTAQRAWPNDVPPNSPESWDTPGHHYVFVKPGYCQYQFVHRTSSHTHVTLILCGVPDSIPECEIVSAPLMSSPEVPDAPKESQ